MRGSVRRGTNLCDVYSRIIQGLIVLLCKMCRVKPFELNNGVLHVLLSVFSLSVLTVRHNHLVVCVCYFVTSVCVHFRPSTFNVFAHVCLRYVYIHIDPKQVSTICLSFSIV